MATVTFKGNEMNLVGESPTVGQPAPGFSAVDTGLAPVSLSDFAGKTVLISAVPSVDTSVCEVQTNRFEREAANLPNVKIVTISLDLPFAHGRFCTANNTAVSQLLSDYQSKSFADAYGVLIKELQLLTRAIFVVSADGTLVYKEIVPEVTDHPDYDAALAAARAAE